MPFDGVDFQAKREEPRRPPPGEKVFGLIFLLLAICSLVLPISMAALVDIVRYLRGS